MGTNIGHSCWSVWTNLGPVWTYIGPGGTNIGHILDGVCSDQYSACVYLNEVMMIKMRPIEKNIGPVGTNMGLIDDSYGTCRV